MRFNLLRTTLIALRGERGRPNKDVMNMDELDINLEPHN
jgi:hypothetical protein